MYRNGVFSRKQEANPIWNENGIVQTEGQSDMKPIRYEMKTVSCKRGLNLGGSLFAKDSG